MRSDMENWKAIRQDVLVHGLSQRAACAKYKLGWHTFGTLLSAGGVTPRTAQAAMRHSSIDLTMTTYTDPKLLDIHGAVESLPSLDLLTELPNRQNQQLQATGTDAMSGRAVAPTVAPTACISGATESFPVVSSTGAVASIRGRSDSKNVVKPNKKPSFAGVATEGQAIGVTRD